MATLIELFDLSSDETLRNKIASASAKKAQTLIDGVTPTAAEIAWANNTIIDPLGRANVLINYVLAANSAASVAAIQGATDNAIQTNVDTAVDALIAGGST